ncbi:DUF4817 domain-containing protein [Trichonephila clavipes]|nr:DUF4817 domain-containing protein [Trichonephila clavipes]
MGSLGGGNRGSEIFLGLSRQKNDISNFHKITEWFSAKIVYQRTKQPVAVPCFQSLEDVIFHKANSSPYVVHHILTNFDTKRAQLLPLRECFPDLSLTKSICCQVIYSQFGLAIHQNDHQSRRRFVEWAQNEIAVVPDRILFSDEAHFWLNGYVNKQNCRIWSETYPQVYVETPLHPEKLTVW